MRKERMDMTGMKIGKLKVIKHHPFIGQTKWECLCDCGKTSIVNASALRNGNTSSCGCGMYEKTAIRSTKHGMHDTRIYRIWAGMRSRCTNSSQKLYYRYGGRGIKFCERWKEFTNFYEDMKDGYEDHLTLDRIDTNGNYEKSNCKWSTRSEQGYNKVYNAKLTFKNQTKLRHEWAVLYGIKEETLRYRLSKGWDIETALTKDVIVRKINT